MSRTNTAPLAASGSRLPRWPRSRRQRVLVGLELMTGAAAVIGGALLTIAPDGSLLLADSAVLEGSPFTDWRPPGVLLAALVGGGFLTAGIWERRGGWRAHELSMLAGLGLMAFEVAELVWIGFHPLEGVFAVVGAAVLGLAIAAR